MFPLYHQIRKRPVRTCRQAEASPAGPSPGGLVCAPEPRLLQLYRKPPNKTSTSVFFTDIGLVCAIDGEIFFDEPSQEKLAKVCGMDQP
jgi:hypothetical protein